MHTWDLFLCHSKKDRAAIAQLDSKLRSDGFKVWLDERDILPGARWEASIEQGVSESRLFLLCISSNWISEKSYAHREQKLAMKLMEEMPEDRVFIIPARLDDCELPRALRALQWVDLHVDDGYERLRSAIQRNIASARPIAPATSKMTPRELADLLGLAYIEIDPWEAWNPKEQQTLDRFQRGQTARKSHDALFDQAYPTVIALWATIASNPTFNVHHRFWTHRGFIRAHIFQAKCDLYVSHVAIGCSDKTPSGARKKHFTAAIKLLRELLDVVPWSQVDQNELDLPAETVAALNEDYVGTCVVTKKWAAHWGGVLIAHYAMLDEQETEELLARADQRHLELTEQPSQAE